MLSVAEAVARARARLRSRAAAWAARPPSADSGAVLEIALHPPTEKQALADQHAAAEWVARWAEVGSGARTAGATTVGVTTADAAAAGAPVPPALSVDWVERSWSRIGRQRVPIRVSLHTPDAVADFVGGDEAVAWTCLSTRAATLRSTFGESEALASAITGQAKRLLGLSDDAFATLVAVVAWLRDHPVGSLRPRQLPIRGVDSKWFEAHRSLVTALLKAAGSAEAVTVLDAEPRMRVRLLDPSSAHELGGLSDITAPVEQLDGLGITPDVVFVFENLESVLSMPEWPGAVAVHGSGYAVDAVAPLRWMRGPRIIYWGDLDSHGFAILSRLRAHLPDVDSVLMDEATLLAHRDLWVTEPTPHPGTFAALTGSEERALTRLRVEGNVRLEQERIPWRTALGTLVVAVGGTD